MAEKDTLTTTLSVVTGGLGPGLQTAGTINANRAQERTQELQQRQANLQAARQKREAIRESRIAYAQAQQNAVNAGAENTSSSKGGLGSIQSQLASNISFLDNFNSLSKQITSAFGDANAWKMWSEIGGQISSTAASVFANAPELGTMFSGGAGAGSPAPGQPRQYTTNWQTSGI